MVNEIFTKKVGYEVKGTLDMIYGTYHLFFKVIYMVQNKIRTLYNKNWIVQLKTGQSKGETDVSGDEARGDPLWERRHLSWIPKPFSDMVSKLFTTPIFTCIAINLINKTDKVSMMSFECF